MILCNCMYVVSKVVCCQFSSWYSSVLNAIINCKCTQLHFSAHPHYYHTWANKKDTVHQGCEPRPAPADCVGAESRQVFGNPLAAKAKYMPCHALFSVLWFRTRISCDDGNLLTVLPMQEQSNHEYCSLGNSCWRSCDKDRETSVKASQISINSVTCLRKKVRCHRQRSPDITGNYTTGTLRYLNVPWSE